MFHYRRPFCFLFGEHWVPEMALLGAACPVGTRPGQRRPSSIVLLGCLSCEPHNPSRGKSTNSTIGNDWTTPGRVKREQPRESRVDGQVGSLLLGHTSRNLGADAGTTFWIDIHPPPFRIGESVPIGLRSTIIQTRLADLEYTRSRTKLKKTPACPLLASETVLSRVLTHINDRCLYRQKSSLACNWLERQTSNSSNLLKLQCCNRSDLQAETLCITGSRMKLPRL